MGLTAFLAMVRKDLLLFLSDRRAVIVAFAVPIAIGSFIGSMTGGMGRSNEPLRIKIAIVDLDESAISKSIVTGAQGDKNLNVTVSSANDARDQVRKGEVSAAVIIPKDFGDGAGRAFFRGASVQKPEMDVLFDPSRAVETGMVRGILTQHVMESVSKEMFSGQSGSRFADEALKNLDSSSMDADRKRLLREMLAGVQRYYRDSTPASAAGGTGGVFSMPYTVHEEEVTSGSRVPYNGYAHSFAGMGIQFLLFAALNMGIEMLVERQRGLWRRLRSAPVSRYMLLGARAASATVISLATLLVSFGFAMVVFGVRIEGSLLGFAMVAVACSMMAATFGLLVAALGRTPGTARGVSTLAVLVMVMLGGAWVPTFLFPKWVQSVTVVVPARWAVDGLDATTWRGLGLSSAVVPTLALLGFAAAFALVTVSRFRWEEPN
jgi:ABC-2 type transport system permease protein